MGMFNEYRGGRLSTTTYILPTTIMWDTTSPQITFVTEELVIERLVRALNKAGIECKVPSNTVEGLVAALKAREDIKADAKALDEFLNSFSNSETT